jgi:hypothetical protein
MQVKSAETSTCLKFSRVAHKGIVRKEPCKTVHEETMEQHGEGGNQCHIAFQIISREKMRTEHESFRPQKSGTAMMREQSLRMQG